MRSPPTWQFLAEALKRGQDVEALLAIDVPRPGEVPFRHYVTITGLQWTDQDMDGQLDRGEPATVHFIDPDGGPTSRNLLLRADGRLYYVGPKGDEVNIRYAVEESPIPAPGTLALLGFGLAALGCVIGQGRARALR